MHQTLHISSLPGGTYGYLKDNKIKGLRMRYKQILRGMERSVGVSRSSGGRGREGRVKTRALRPAHFIAQQTGTNPFLSSLTISDCGRA
jgi:hypothetical protein